MFYSLGKFNLKEGAYLERNSKLTMRQGCLCTSQSAKVDNCNSELVKLPATWKSPLDLLMKDTTHTHTNTHTQTHTHKHTHTHRHTHTQTHPPPHTPKQTPNQPKTKHKAKTNSDVSVKERRED